MAKYLGEIMGAIEIAAGLALHQPWLVKMGIVTEVTAIAQTLLMPGVKPRQAQATQVQVGEVTRRGIFGTGASPGSLVDAFNFGGKYGTDWTVYILAIADHRCEALTGFYANDTFVPYTGDGLVPDLSDTVKFRGQLQVYWRDGQWDQEVPEFVLSTAPVVKGTPTWTVNDRGRSVAWIVFAFKADTADQKNPVWSAGTPNFLPVVKGLRCYSARLDGTVGGSGPHRRGDPSTWEWSENPIDCRYNFARGIYAGDKVDQPEMLLLGRGLSDVEAPPENVFAPANLCDERVPLKGVLSSLSLPASAGDHTVTLSSVTGLADSMQILIAQPGGLDETVTVESVAGDAVTLTGGLAYDHPALTPVSWAAEAGGAVTEARYKIGGVFGGDDAYIDTEGDFAAACGGWIVEREGSVELVPGSAQPVVWHITDEDLLIGSTVTAADFRSETDDAWCNSVAVKYVEPTQKWSDHSAPIRRVYADIIADGKPRLVQPNALLCTSGTQSQRVGEQARRLGRLPSTRSIVLGPRFIGAEHGDWLSWTSDRYSSGGLPILLRIESDSQDAKWQNSLGFRQVAADVFDWDAQADELADGAVAVQAAAPVFGDAPGDGTWSLAAVTDTGDGSTGREIVFTGTVDDDTASAVMFEYARTDGAPAADDDGAWTSSGIASVGAASPYAVKGMVAGVTYWGAVSYSVAGVRGDRLVIGPATTDAGPSADGRILNEDGGLQVGEDGSQIIKE